MTTLSIPFPRRRPLWSVAVLLGSASLLLNCKGDGVTAPRPDSVVASVNLVGAPLDGVILVGQSPQFVATAKNASGEALSNKTISWTTSNSAVASVSTSGVVAASAAGYATISATADGKNASTDVAIRAPLPTPAARRTEASRAGSAGPGTQNCKTEVLPPQLSRSR